MILERFFRTIAYQAVVRRDGYPGVISYREDFKKFAAKPSHAMEAFCMLKLQGILNHAFYTSPYYRNLWQEIGFNPSDIKTLENITDLPFLTKEIIEEQKSLMISNQFKAGELESSHTGGSSGTPTSFYRDPTCTSMRMGRQWGILERCGYGLGERCALIWGVHEDLPDPAAKIGLKKRFRQFAAGKEILSCTIMSADKMMDFYRRLERFAPSVLYGYPNAMSEFASFIKEKRLPRFQVRAIICTAERLTESQRSLLSEVFEGEVFNLYCTREHGCVGFECRKHKGLHIDIGSVYMEIISGGKPAKSGEPGEIVVTDLLNYGMPFIRYKIGDWGRLSKEPCDCGCGLPLLESLEGRVSDILYRPDGSQVAGVMLIDLFMDEPKILNMQIIQESLNRVDMYLVVAQTFSREDKARAIKEMKKYMSEQVEIDVRIVPDIPRNPRSGKFQEVICKIGM